MLYNACGDLNSPMEPLKLEIIPPHERGRATGAMTWCSNLGSITFYFIALGRFDDVTYFSGFPLRGETAIYWSAALLLSVMFLLITLGIREVEQPSTLRGQRLSPRNFFGGLLDRELWPVYMLVVGSACLNFYSGLGPLSNLLYTDQWNYTKQEMGINVAVGGILNIFAIGLLTIFADRLNRMRAYQTLICLSLTVQVFYYCYVNFVLPDKRPTLVEIIVFGETLSILGILTGLVYTPLVYDYIQRNKMGTFNAGAGVVGRLTTLVTLNGVGLFVWGYAILFQPPSGEMTRVVVSDAHVTQREMLAKLHAASWTFPGRWQPRAFLGHRGHVVAGRWHAQFHRAVLGNSPARSRQQKLAEARDHLTADDAPILADEKMLRDSIAVRQRENADASVDQRRLTEDQGRSDALEAKINADSTELDRRAKIFHDEVVRVLGNSILVEGDEILAASSATAIVLDLPVAQRPDPRELEKIVAHLRQNEPGVIDLRPLKRDDGYAVTVSALSSSTAEQASFAGDLQTATEAAITSVDAKLLAAHTGPANPRLEPAVTLDLEILEDPVPTYVSPITGVVNAVLGLFGDPPDPQRRLQALARGIRLPGQLEQISVRPGAAPKTLAITAVMTDSTPEASVTDAETARLQQLLGQGASPHFARRAQTLLQRVEEASATQRITPAHPSLATAYARMKYDYMSGYLWMFVMGSLGIAITVAFRRVEAMGFVRKRGVEEAEQS